MKFSRTLYLTILACIAFGSSFTSHAQSCSGNLLHDATGYYGGFESGNQSIGASRGLTDLNYGSQHGAYQVVSETNKPWDDYEGGGYLPVNPHSGDFMMLIHTGNTRLWYKPLSVVPGQTFSFCAWIASGKTEPVNGFEVRLLVKYGNKTNVIATSVAQQGKWSQICGSFTVPAGVNNIEFQLIDPFSANRISNFLFLDDICIRNVQQLNPDVNVTYTNVPVTGNTATNDGVPSGSTYGTPAAVAGNPAGATISMQSNGSYTFTAITPGVYVYNVPVCVAAQSTNCPFSILTITVLQKAAVSNLPVANTDYAETRTKTSVSINTLANDAAGTVNILLNPSSVTVIEAPKNGTASVNPSTGVISYTPNSSFVGNDTLRYRVCDRSVPAPLCATALQIIVVKPASAPNFTTAADDYVATPINTAVTGNVKLNDNDSEGNTQTVAAKTTTIAGKGTLVLLSDGSFTFTPTANYVGPVLFTYTTCDNGTAQACANATLYILVEPFSSMTPLPVGLVSLNGKTEAGNVRLAWETASEASVSYYVVEHSTSGSNWQPVGTVKATGSSNTATRYDFTHNTPVSGANQYRLQVVELSGSKSISNIITVKMSGSRTAIGHAYPNPFNGQLQLTVHSVSSAKASIQLLDINGRLVQQTERLMQSGDNLITVNGLAKLPGGTYIVKIVAGETTQTQKVFK